MAPRASVIIPHHRDPNALRVCLKALFACDGIAATEVLVVDNGAATLTPAFQQAFPAVRFLFEPRAGAAHARNLGVAHAKADALLFLDCDCIPHRRFITAHLRALSSADMVGGEIEVSTSQAMTGPEAFERVFAFRQRDNVQRKGFAVTANLSTHRSVFQRVGSFRHGLSEDLDWCRRARDAGFTLTFCAEATITHPARATWAALSKKWGRLTREAYASDADRPGARARWLARAVAMPLSIIAHAPRILRSSALPGAPAKGRALLTLARIRLWRMGAMLRCAVRPPAARPLVARTSHRSL